jgi:hypothetical protein
MRRLLQNISAIARTGTSRQFPQTSLYTSAIGQTTDCVDVVGRKPWHSLGTLLVQTIADQPGMLS